MTDDTREQTLRSLEYAIALCEQHRQVASSLHEPFIARHIAALRALTTPPPQPLAETRSLTTAELMERLENYYDFTCEAGPLKQCIEWQQLKAALPTPREDRHE